MSVVPSRTDDIIIKGLFKFRAAPLNENEIEDSYYLQIIVPHNFPKELPIVFEIDNKILRHPDNHINKNGSLCLGTPLSIMIVISINPTLTLFTRYLLIPYLYAISRFRIIGDRLIFGELDHGNEGILQDYGKIFHLKTLGQIKEALIRLGLKKRLANKKPCPCGCGVRYGRCKFRFHLEKFRYLSSRAWFRSQANNIRI